MMGQYLKTSLGECCEIVSGATPKISVEKYWGGEVRWATPRDLSNLGSPYISDTPRKITEAGLRSCSARLLPTGSVLLSSRAPIGHVAISKIPMATNQGFKSLIPNPLKVDAKYLYHWLRANRSYLDSLGNGATFKEVSKETVSRVELPLPEIMEQRRIAGVLDQVEVLRAKRRETLAQLGELTQSIFFEMFGDPATSPKKWPLVKIGAILQSANYGTSEKASTDGEFPVLRMNNLTRSGEIDLSSLKYMNLSSLKRDRYLVRRGDVLFNRTNSPELVGKTAIYRAVDQVAYAGYLIRLRTNERADPEYLAAFLNTERSKTALRGMCKSIIGMANINAKEVQGMLIPLPPLNLQQQFASRIGAIERLKVSYRAHMNELDALFASLQHRAFRGEL